MRHILRAELVQPRPLPFILASSIPYDLDVLEFENQNVHPTTAVFSEQRPDASGKMSTHYTMHITVGGQTPILGKTKFCDLTNAQQNLIIAHEMLHVLISYHPYMLDTTSRLDRMDRVESNFVSDIIVDYCATLFRKNYLFGAMTGFKNLLLFHNRTFIGLSKTVERFLATKPDPMNCRLLYMQESLLQSTGVRKSDPVMLQSLSKAADWSSTVLGAHNRLCTDLLQFGAWVRQEKYDFLADPELADDTEFIERLREIIERFIKTMRTDKPQQKQSTPSTDHAHSSFRPGKGVPDLQSGNDTAEVERFLNGKHNEKDRQSQAHRINTSSINSDTVRKQTNEILDNLDDPTFGLGGDDTSHELITATIKHSTLLDAKREVTHFMDHAMRVAMQDPTGVQGNSLVDGTEGSFHFNVEGAIQAVRKKAHPTLFRALSTAKIKRKTILAIFDVSSSMEVFNKELKPWLAAFFISNLHAYFTVKVVDFAIGMIEDHLPYNKAAYRIENDGGTDPFGTGRNNAARLTTWKSLIRKIKPNAIIFVSDMEFTDENWRYDQIVYNHDHKFIKPKAESYIQERFDGLGFKGKSYVVLAPTNDYNRLTLAKEDARKALKSIINDQSIRY